MSWLDSEDGINEARWEREMAQVPRHDRDARLGRDYLVFGATVRIVAFDQGCVQLEEISTTDRARRWIDEGTWNALCRSGAVVDA